MFSPVVLLFCLIKYYGKIDDTYNNRFQVLLSVCRWLLLLRVQVSSVRSLVVDE